MWNNWQHCSIHPVTMHVMKTYDMIQHTPCVPPLSFLAFTLFNHMT